MAVPNLTPLQKSLKNRISELEEKQRKQEDLNRGDGSTPATWRKVEPKIKRDVAEDCLTDLDDVEDLDDVLELLAEWRRSRDQIWRFKTTNPRVENSRNDIKRAEIMAWIDYLIELVPESEFRSCGLCGSTKMPESDRRRKNGFKWECPECGI